MTEHPKVTDEMIEAGALAMFNGQCGPSDEITAESPEGKQVMEYLREEATISLNAALTVQPEHPRLVELEAWKRDASDKLVQAGMAISDVQEHATTLAAQVEDLRDALRNLLLAVDNYGVDYWDTDSLPDEVEAIIKASSTARKLIQGDGDE